MAAGLIQENRTQLRDEKVAIIGSGQIGSSWALLFASAGYQVSVYDSDAAAVTRALDIVKDQLCVLEKGDLLRGTLTADQQLERIQTVDSVQKAVQGALWVQECVPEDLALKKEVFSKIGQWADNSMILASSTSSFLPSVLSSDLQHKEKFLVVHPTNPPFYTRAVELVPAPWTSPDTMAAAKRLMKEIGQAPIVLKKEIAGFVLNRMQFALMAECLRLVKDKVLDVDGVNKMFSAGLGRRYAFIGPFQTAHLNADGFGSYCERYGPMIHRVQQSFGPPVPPKGEIIENIECELVTQVPLNKLADARREKERRLMALMKLKKQLDDADVKSSQ